MQTKILEVGTTKSSDTHELPLLPDTSRTVLTRLFPEHFPSRPITELSKAVEQSLDLRLGKKVDRNQDQSPNQHGLRTRQSIHSTIRKVMDIAEEQRQTSSWARSYRFAIMLDIENAFNSI